MSIRIHWSTIAYIHDGDSASPAKEHLLKIMRESNTMYLPTTNSQGKSRISMAQARLIPRGMTEQIVQPFANEFDVEWKV